MHNFASPPTQRYLDVYVYWIVAREWNHNQHVSNSIKNDPNWSWGQTRMRLCVFQTNKTHSLSLLISLLFKGWKLGKLAQFRINSLRAATARSFLRYALVSSFQEQDPDCEWVIFINKLGWGSWEKVRVVCVGERVARKVNATRRRKVR